MLRVLGGPKRLCNGVTRRDLLTVGGLGMLGVNAPWLCPTTVSTAAAAEARESNGLPGFGRAKNVILLYLFGGPSHLETFDMKPQAPVEVRGEMKGIATTLPGCEICEGLPNVARVMDRTTVVRSLSHPWNFHGMQYATTGLAVGSVPVEETLVHEQHQPFLGSVVNYFDEQSGRRRAPDALPDNIFLPFPLSSRRPAPYLYARPYGPAREIHDPYLGVTRDSRFLIVPEAEFPEDLPLDRLDKRRSLLEQLETARRKLDRHASKSVMDQKRELAFALLESRAVREAFDLERESAALRDAYGMTLFGQATLQARRLVEAGCRFVTVVWDEFGQLNSGWDTHVDHYNRLRNDLLPGFDRAYSALLLDLEERGLLDETLVLVMNEMGRTPRFEKEGRGHWGKAYSNLFAGAGIRKGNIVGRTDRIGGTVVDRPLSAKDVLATIYHLVGINPEQTLPDRLNRPVPLVHDGKVVPEMLA
jgi:hypothetical protein